MKATTIVHGRRDWPMCPHHAAGWPGVADGTVATSPSTGAQECSPCAIAARRAGEEAT